MSERDGNDAPKVVGWLPGGADLQIQSIWLIGAIAIPFAYGWWQSTTTYPYVVGAWLFIEMLWLIVVLMWLAAWDMGTWLSGPTALRNRVQSLVAPRLLVSAVPAPLREWLTDFFNRYVHLVALLVGLLIGHVFWH